MSDLSRSQHTFDADILSAAIASPRQPIPLDAILIVRSFQLAAIFFLSSFGPSPYRSCRTIESDKKASRGPSLVVQKIEITKSKAAFSASGRRKNLAGLSFATSREHFAIPPPGHFGITRLTNLHTETRAH